MIDEKIWYQDPGTFFRPEEFLDVLPDATLPYNQRLNRVVRLAIYASAIGYLVFRDVRAVYPTLLAMAGSYLLYGANESVVVEEESTEHYVGLDRDRRAGKGCTRPTKNNPFMNVTINEYVDNPRRPPACPVPEVTDEIDLNFQDTLFKDVDDVYQRSTAIRNYHTVPSTTIPNAQDDFARWCYGNSSKTCKEGNGLACKYFTPHK